MGLLRGVVARRAALVAVSSVFLPRPGRSGVRSGAHAWPQASAGRGAAVPAPELATPYREQVDPARCFVSEKYDGVRALWDGTTFRHRSGRTIAAPRAVLAALPEEPLDGELWLGRGRFEPLSAIVRRAAATEGDWAAVRYMVFDQPLAPGSFEERLLRLRQVLSSPHGPAELAPQRRLPDRAALERALGEVVAGGGEGIVLHVASAPHVGGRSDAVFKMKPFLDAEARVVGYRRGGGKYGDAVGAIEVESVDGKRFFLGSGMSDRDRRDPPAIGSLVTYRYRDVTSGGLPRFATYLRRYEAE